MVAGFLGSGVTCGGLRVCVCIYIYMPNGKFYIKLSLFTIRTLEKCKDLVREGRFPHSKIRLSKI